MMYFLTELAYNLFWLAIFPTIVLFLCRWIVETMEEKNYHESHGYNRRYYGRLKRRLRHHV